VRFGIVLNTQAPPLGENIATVYEEALREAEVAEKSGFELAVVGEHHHSPDGYLPSALTFCAALAARTSKMIVASDVMQLPMWHPVHVAEIGSVIDNISRGRFVLGVGLGQKDRSSFGISRQGIVARFEESVEIVRRAWTNETFSFAGEHFNLEQVRVSPRPVQSGGPPIWVGALSKPGLERAGRIGDGWPTDNLQSLETIKRWAGIYRETAAKHSRRSGVALARSAWIAQTRSEVKEKWWPYVKAFYQPYIRLGLFKDITLDGDPSNWSFDQIARNRLVAGTPDEVIREIERYKAEVACESMILLFRHPQGPSHKEVLGCIELFGKEVIPQFKRS
jgi:alkanesulfonate monooxygenase SsuD/methylene tetrahydromethanopterin reductase-like flavin-dependent oxidoreductase (luciferase family)